MKRWLFAILLYTSVQPAAGQNTMGQNTIGLPLIVNYLKADFHGGSQTWGIAQDKNGFMYFANNEGLIAFDGTYWKIYPLPNRTIMRSIAIQNQRIYAGGQGEMGYFYPDSSGFLRYHSLVDLLPDSQNKFADIWDIKILGESIFFRATDRIFELRNNTVQVFHSETEWQFLSVAGDRLIAQDKKFGLLQYRNNEWIPLKNNQLLDKEIVSGITPTRNDSFLITTIKKNAYLLKNDSLFRTNTFTGISSLNTSIFKTAQLNKNEFVAATTSEGCLIMNYNGNRVQTISRMEGLQNNSVLCVYLDKDSNLWAGVNNGISLIAYNAAIKYIRPNKTDELSGYSARIFNNQLYIGSSNGAYVVPVSPDKKDLSFSMGSFSLIKNSNGQVWRLDEINQQIIMGHNPGTYLIRSGEATLISWDPTWMFLPISAVCPSQYVIAGTYTGLKLLNYTNDRFTDLGNLEGTYESFRFLAMDNNNIIWASHPYRGVYQLQLSPDKRKYNARLFTDQDGLPSTLNNFVFRIKNRIVFATVKGAYEFDPSTGKFGPSAFLRPVFGSMELRYLNEDADGNIWFCSGKKLGVVHFTGVVSDKPSEKGFVITWFPELTGDILSGFENVYPYNSENVFVSSEKGIIHLNYKKYIHNKVELSVLLGNVKILGNPDSTIFGGYLQKMPPHLPAHFNSYHFEYSSPNCGLQKDIEFSYKLEGYDKNWSAWTLRTEKDYTNLPDGRYVFKVKAHDNLGNESQAYAYPFIIDPPIYKTAWAYILYGLLLLLLVYGVKKGLDKRLHLQKIKYEESQKQIIALHNLEIEKNEKEIIKLQNEKLANEVLLKKKELADASMHLIEREDALTRVKDELQRLYKKTGDNHDVKIAIQLLNGIEKNNSNWDQFASHFNEISNDFLKKLKSNYPGLTNSDLKVCAYLQLNLSSKEIAQLMNISVRGVEMSRYRIRKKLRLPQDQSLNEFLNSIG